MASTDWTRSAAMSDPDDITEPITAWAVYGYEKIEDREMDGKRAPLYYLKRITGGWPTEAAAREAKDEEWDNFLTVMTVLPDRGEVFGF